MKVYILLAEYWTGSENDFEILGIFDSKEKIKEAKKHLKKIRDYKASEYQVYKLNLNEVIKI